jgi:hypothetical protein
MNEELERIGKESMVAFSQHLPAQSDEIHKKGSIKINGILCLFVCLFVIQRRFQYRDL